MDTPSTPVHNARGGRLFVFDVDKDGNPTHPPIHEDDLTPAQRAQVGLPPLETPAPKAPTQVTEEEAPDV